MNTVTLENQILSKLKELDQEEKVQLCDYLKMRGPKRHSQRSYKKLALRQIRTALKDRA